MPSEKFALWGRLEAVERALDAEAPRRSGVHSEPLGRALLVRVEDDWVPFNVDLGASDPGLEARGPPCRSGNSYKSLGMRRSFALKFADQHDGVAPEPS